ncbi:MAG: TonB family protein [Acidobacteria bacterium]|nr:TonB family protein [Acidobacteriota bacterium]
MSTDPKTAQPPGGAKPQSLEDAVYTPSLASGNSTINKGNPLVTIPVTILVYGSFVGVGFWLGAQTKAGKAALKTVGVTLDQPEEAPPPPPPPPPPPAPVAAPVVVKKDLEQKEPPPPPDPSKDIVPDVVPKELPKEDLSAKYAVGGNAATGAPSGVVGAGTGTQSVMGAASQTRVVDFDFSQIKIKVQPPAPPYPAMARIAKIQGTVVVEIVVGTDGVPVSAKAVDGPPQLRPTAESYAMQWRFEPAMLNGVPQNARLKLTMPFKLRA